MKPPPIFFQFCRIAHFTTEQATDNWNRIVSQTNFEFLNWLTGPDSGINDSQRENIQTQLKDFIASPQPDIFSKLVADLNPQTKTQAAKFYAFSFTNQLSQFEDQLKATLTPDEKQVLSSLIKV